MSTGHPADRAGDGFVPAATMELVTGSDRPPTSRCRRRSALRSLTVLVAAVLAACGATGDDDPELDLDRGSATTGGTAPAAGPDRDPPGRGDEPTDQDPGAVTGGPRDAPIEIALRLDRRVDDAATEGFEAVVRATLSDERGWERAGFRFRFDHPDPPFSVVLAEGPEVDALCAPYDTGGRFSCQIGPVVALNADRWRHATPQWTGDLAAYRQMLVNHEVGHLLGQHHPETPCPGPGLPAPVMAQQSTSLGPCQANPWPLDWEIRCAAIVGLEPLAPGHESAPQPLCGPDGPTG